MESSDDWNTAGVVEPREAGAVVRHLRPLGYLGIGVVWLVLTAISVLLWALLPLILAATSGTLRDAQGIVSLRDDPSNLTAFILSMIIVPPFFVYVLLAVTVGCASLMLLSLIYFGRALDPRYNDRKLSRTDYVVDAVGPPLAAFVPKALSLMPTWRSRSTDVLASLTTLAFRPGFGIVLSSWVLGLCYFFTVGWALWPVHGAVFALCLTTSVLLGVVGTWLLIRNGIARYRKLSAEVAENTDAVAQTQSE